VGKIKTSSSLPLHAQERRTCIVLFKTAPCPFFLQKWNVIRKNPKMGYDSMYEMKELEDSPDNWTFVSIKQ